MPLRFLIKPPRVAAALVAALTIIAILAGAGLAQASTDGRGEAEAPPRPADRPAAPLNPQPEPPGIAAPPEGEPAEGVCTTCPPAPPPPPPTGPPTPPAKTYEIEITDVKICNTEDNSGTDEVYIRINGEKVWGIWGLHANWPGYDGCTNWPLFHREAVRSFKSSVNVDIYDEDWPDPDDWLGHGTAWTTNNPTKPWNGMFNFAGSNYHYKVYFEVRPI